MVPGRQSRIGEAEEIGFHNFGDSDLHNF